MQNDHLPTGYSFLPIGLKKRLREMIPGATVVVKSDLPQGSSCSIFLNIPVWKKTVADWKSGFIMAGECLYLGSCKRPTALSLPMIDPRALFNH